MPKAVDFRRKGLTAAALGAAGVLAVSLLQDIATAIISLIGAVGYSLHAGGGRSTVISASWFESLTTTLPFAAGVFVSLWQFAPIGGVLRLGHVVARSVLAAASGAAVVLAIGVVVNVARGVASFVEREYAFVGDDASNLLLSVGFAVQTAALTFVAGVPLVVLSGFLLWLWTRSTDRDHRVEGTLDL